MAGEDRRLERLFDYTKFHIGLYMAIGGGLVTLLSAATAQGSNLKSLVGTPWLLLVAVICTAGAGFAGGVIASSATQCSTFDDFWTKPQGPLWKEWFKGRQWTYIEHTLFWIGLIAAALSFLGGKWSVVFTA